MKILITGFTPYKPFPTNASEELIRSFQAELPTELIPYADQLTFEVISFNDEDAPSQSSTMTRSLFALLEEHKPDVCIFCGQAPKSCKIQIEKIAIAVFRGEPIIPQGPLAYGSTLPGQDELPTLLKEKGIPCALSYHAGTHLCNHVLYTTLHHTAINELGIKAGFVHIPVNEQQAIELKKTQQYSSMPFMPLKMSRAALTLIILNILNTDAFRI